MRQKAQSDRVALFVRVLEYPSWYTLEILALLPAAQSLYSPLGSC
ncbi:hypothetical protein AB434_1542 [Heyndrickxia coagulans]|uniref:Uncharacterized protein n=1 Tax=Heyndrickxia coagulans TaxID=1398 RepID=A0AAN0T8U6_HEYCO|nr:hypothetical protein SB48_HM08orf06054 [Heyndrickxia coagulans]AKN53947.1 hypothetical protein AB434_1542 [Heyndrickxia coagulans]KYC86070.1 hypothetical protein B4096_1046 [Heyndrickxia coagulans]